MIFDPDEKIPIGCSFGAIHIHRRDQMWSWYSVTIGFRCSKIAIDCDNQKMLNLDQSCPIISGIIPQNQMMSVSWSVSQAEHMGMMELRFCPFYIKSWLLAACQSNWCSRVISIEVGEIEKQAVISK
jgi:hypothetical protein